LLPGEVGILFFEDFSAGFFKLFEKLLFSQALFLNYRKAIVLHNQMLV
jgi:hypothetical protein